MDVRIAGLSVMGKGLLKPHGLGQLSFRLPMTVSYIALRYLLVPLLYVPYRLGISPRWAYWFDTNFKRAVFPLTEHPDARVMQQVPSRLKIGDPLPDVSVTTRSGPVNLSTFSRGRPLLLIVFRGSWCPYSRMHMTDLAKNYEVLKQHGFEVVAVGTQADEEWWNERDIRFPIAADPDGVLFERLGMKIDPPVQHRVFGMSFPHESVFLFDKDSRLVAYDARRVSNTKLRQTFLDGTKWLELGREKDARAAS